jgi:signal transduction histidine kinase
MIVGDDVAAQYLASLERPLNDMLRDLGLSSWLAAPLVAHERPIGVIHLLMSTPARRYGAVDIETATELGQRAGAAIENARLHRDAQEALRLREQVLAVVSHDLRNPLYAIELGAEMIERQTTEPPVQKHVATIKRSAERMERLILDLVDMANINAGHLAIQRAPVDACDVVRELIEMYDPLAVDQGITLVRTGDVRGVIVKADRNRLMQALGNLVGNALKFCTRGGTVTIQAAREQDRVRIAVADTGPGIRVEDLPHLFKPFWSGRARADRASTNGMGMGLYITRAIVEAHDGTIAAANLDSGGARFTITLPLAT